jgi:hypothetical protein
MSLVRNLVKIVFCVSLTGCQTLPGVASRKLPPDADRKIDAPAAAQTARGQSSEIRPIDGEGGVVHLKLSADGLRERTGDAPLPLPKPVIDLPTPDSTRIPALQKELARQLSLKIEDLRAKIQVLNAQAMARSTPPQIIPVDTGKPTVGEQKLVIARIADPLPILTPVLAEEPTVRPVAHTEPTVPGDVPTASQREINRLITQCLSDLEKEVRELGDRVRAISPPVK